MSNIREVIFIVKAITLRLDDELHKQFKIYSAQQEKTMQEIIIALMKKELSQAEQKK